jgi:hypothetical protein
VPQIRFPAALGLLCCLSVPPATRAQSHPFPGGEERVGSVNFPTSCSPETRDIVKQGLALLHSFQYQEAEQAFARAGQLDGGCAIAYWGKAMALYHQVWDFPDAKNLADGRHSIEQAQKLGAKTNREGEYVAAAAAFFQESPKMSHSDRVKAYSSAMQKLYLDNPQDNEAGEFYALSLIALAQMDSENSEYLRKAISILNPIFTEYPNNPGAAHYLIHATDSPELAAQGLPAARAYAAIAPDSAHALHMPSHIFRRLGLWQEVIDSNLASAAAAAKAAEAHLADANYEFHALDFLDYAYLQSGQESKARDLVREIERVPGASPKDIIDQQNLLAARNALELHRWKEAAALAVPLERIDWQDVAYWTRTIGAARNGDLGGARANARKLFQSIEARNADQRKRGNTVPAGNSVDHLEAEGWLAYVEGKQAEAVSVLQSAADREDSEHSDPFAMPAREMLGDLLMELKRPSDALVEYQAVLKNYPNRFDALMGSAQAARSFGDRVKMAQYCAKILAISSSEADRPEMRDAMECAGGPKN